jgi:hypothetical protein
VEGGRRAILILNKKIKGADLNSQRILIEVKERQHKPLWTIF